MNLNYEFKDSILGTLPSKLNYIIEKIKESENILTLEDNWDTYGSKKYLHKTWISAINFLITYSNEIYTKFGSLVGVPKIYPSSKGSIDIFWGKSGYSFLVNISEEGIGTFYGSDKKQENEGKFNPNDFNINFLPLIIKNSND